MSSNTEKKRGGCLTKLIKWAVIVFVLSLFLSRDFDIALKNYFYRQHFLANAKDRTVAPITHFAFNGSSQDLKTTKILATLEEPLPKNSNAVWSASFLSSWKSDMDFLKEPVAFKNESRLSPLLNNAPDPRSSIPAENLYAITGKLEDGIVERINNDLKQKFPNKTLPVFPSLAKENKPVVSYAYLQASLRFTFPYNQNDKPLNFTDSQGNSTALNSFGIRKKDEYVAEDLRKQAWVLYAPPPVYIPEIFTPIEKRHTTNGANTAKQEIKPVPLPEPKPIPKPAPISLPDNEFIIDLDGNTKPSRLILARVAPKETLAKTIAYVEEKIATHQPKYLGLSDTLLVPDIIFNISHRFSELEGQYYANKSLEGYQLGLAQQDILFRLDRNGADLEAEAEQLIYLSSSMDYIVNRPFLVYMKNRDTNTPYFAMWVDNAELLDKWSAQ